MSQVIDVLREDNPFVGREREQQEYSAFINAEDEDPPWLLVISGLGGIGKSTLLKHFCQLTPADQATLLDFNTEVKAAQPDATAESMPGQKSSLLYDPSIRTDPLQFLTLLAMELQSHCDAARYATFTDVLERSREQLERLPEPVLQRSQNTVDEGVQPADLTDDDLQAIHLSNLEVRRQTRELVTEAFYAQVETFAPERLIIMLDTCELLNEPDSWGFSQWLMNSFLPTLHERMWRRPCYIIMASRIPLESSTIQEQEQKHITLSMLEKSAVNAYLEQIGVDASWYDKIYAMTRGHALYVAIVGKLYQENGPALFQNMYASSQDGGQTVQKELDRDVSDLLIQKRILKNLKPPFDDLTQYGVILRVFTLPLLRVIFPELLPETNASLIFDQFIRYPYIESKGNYRYTFHELIREVLAKEIQKRHPTEWRSYNERAFSYFTTGTSTSHTMDWYYHNLARCEVAGVAYDREGITAWRAAIREARERKDTQRVSSLLQITNDMALNLSSLSRAICAYEWGLYYYADRILSAKAMEKYQLAWTLYEQATVFPEEIKWNRRHEEIEQEIRHGKIDLLQAMGDMKQSGVELDQAISYYQQSLDLLRQDASHSPEVEAHLLTKIGDVAQLYKEPQLPLAMDSYSKALALFQQVGNTTQAARILKSLGDVQRSQQHPEEATEYYNQALKIFQASKDRSKGDEAALWRALGDVEQLHRDTSALKTALNYYQKAFGLSEDTNLRKQIKQAIDQIQMMLRDEATQQLPYIPSPATSPLTTNALPATHPKNATGKRPRMLFAGFILVLLILVVSGGIFFSTRPRNVAVAPSSLPAQQAIYKQIVGTSPVLNDTFLNTSSNGWEEIQHPDAGGVSGCSSSSDTAYHATAARASYSQFCFAQHTPNFYNFAYQVDMTITGDVGGIIFRANEQNASYYLFGISTDGSYFLSLSTSGGATGSQNLAGGSSKAIHTGSSRRNTLAVITSKDNIYLYINGQYVAQANDNTFDNSPLPHGQIGVFAENHAGLQTDVAFSQAQVWMNAQDSAQAVATTAHLQALDEQTKDLYTQVTSEPPTLQDPLTSSGTNKWEQNQTPQKDGCLFIHGSYHAIMPTANRLEYCEESAQQFHNFAYQATLTMLKGNVGGILFNGAGVGKPQFYYFEINIADNSYFFARHMGAKYDQIKTLRANSSAAIHANLNVHNTLTVIAQNGTFFLYINGQFVDKVADNTFSSGNVGVVADNFGHPTDITFSSVKVWKLA